MHNIFYLCKAYGGNDVPDIHINLYNLLQDVYLTVCHVHTLQLVNILYTIFGS